MTYDNCVSTDATHASQAAFHFEGSTNAPRVVMNGCRSNGGFRIVDITGGKLQISGGHYVIAGDWFGRVQTGAEINVHGAVVDFTNSTNTEALIRMGGTSAATVTGTRIIEGSSRCTGVFHDEDGTGTKTCKYGGIYADSGSLALSASGSASVLTATKIELA